MSKTEKNKQTEAHMKNLREQAMDEILNAAKDSNLITKEALKYLSDTNLFALYFSVFGHAVGC